VCAIERCAVPILDASGVLASVGQGVAAGMAEHVSVDREGKASKGLFDLLINFGGSCKVGARYRPESLLRNRN
jgi:hypothetical protein